MEFWCIFLVTAALSATVSAQCSNAGCYPPSGDLTQGRTIYASSICTGQYCPDGINQIPCSNGSGPQAINDNDNGTFWISETGSSLNLPVTLQLQLESEMIFFDATITWQSPTPSSMILERSSDNGDTWLPYRYWSTDCQSVFNLPTTSIDEMTVLEIQDPICTNSQLNETQITFSTLSHLPVNISMQTKQSYQTITNLRLNLTALSDNSSTDCNEYIAISELVVNGTCLCNGHAEACSPVPAESIISNKVYAGCACTHGTQGTHCEQCQQGFTQAAWIPNMECIACNCNDHSDDCLPNNGCINCTDNTDGYDCSVCTPGYYANSSLMQTNTNYCISCGCTGAGAVNGSCDVTGVCNCKANVNPSLSSKCSVCADGYWNLSLSNNDGCQVCDGCGQGVSIVNSLPLCNKTTGQCICQNSKVRGEMCDSCENGYFDLSSGCSLKCTCNRMGSINELCTVSGQCYCKENITGTLCNRVASGYYFRSLDDIRMEGEEGNLSIGMTPYLPIGGTGFTGRGFARFPATGGNITFTTQVDVTSRYLILIRYQESADVIPISMSIESISNVTRTLQCTDNAIAMTTSITYQVDLLMNQMSNDEGRFCFQEGVQYIVTLSYSPQSPGIEWLLDSVILSPDISHVSDYFNLLPLGDMIAIEFCLPYNVYIVRGLFCDQVIFNLSIEFYQQVFPCGTLNPAGVANSNTPCDSYGGAYECITNYTGLLCNECANSFFYHTATNTCQACPFLCNETGSVNVACDVGTGSCQCKPGVIGDKCNRCLYDNYDFTNSGCFSSCACSPYGICNGSNCVCPFAVTGVTCDQCLDVYYSISSAGCVACDCNPRGSSTLSCHEVTGECPCHNDAIGLQCNDCPSSHYKTEGKEQNLCLPCFCFNHTQDCTANSDSYTLDTVESDFSTLCSPVLDCIDGWTLVDNNVTIENRLFLSGGSGIGYDLTNGVNTNLVAPSKFHGDFHLAYGQSITIIITHTSGLSTPSRNASIWISGTLLAEPLVSQFPTPVITGQVDVWEFIIPLNETYWRVGSEYSEGTVSTVDQLVSILTDVTDIRFSAKYTTNIFELNYLKSFNISFLQKLTVQNSSNPLLVTVGSCTCPTGLTGQFCDECSVGYYRPSMNLLDNCLPCDCNDKAISCDYVTGVCLNCTGNTQGDHCQQCLPGFYDNDPSKALDCLQCLCPSADNSHSPTCVPDNGTVICDACEIGYTGLTCELCANGYFGESIFGQCISCECNGHIDSTLLQLACNSSTGECINCLNDTVGSNCERCKPGYYGNIPHQPCQSCQCNSNGTVSVDDICNITNGSCLCRPRVAQPDCSQCEIGYYGDPANGGDCLSCLCPTVPNSHSTTCILGEGGDPVCDNCERGYTGDTCQFCENGFYGNASSGSCIDCMCNGNIDLSLGSSCDTVTGQCMNCTNNTFGNECQFCDLGYYGNVQGGQPCQSCDIHCSINGTERDICERSNGSCLCRPRVAQPDCSQCEIGYYGDPTNGGDCLSCLCPTVPNSHSTTCILGEDGDPVCDNCERGYTGERCQFCENGFYGNAMEGMCRACDCNNNTDTSLGLTCNSTTGECLLCQNNTFGFNCDQCLPGYYGNIKDGIPCQECSCLRNGTEAGICNATTGNCLCLPMTVGSECSVCMDGYWGVSTDHGCISCDCCSNGSLFSTCNQTTGDCICFGDVRESMDNKCCQCSLGYYNFSVTGCTACNCDDQLSMSIQCNETGHCPCAAGGIGKTCDMCEVGYYADGSNCTTCHKCHFSWAESLSKLQVNVTFLFNRVHEVLLFYEGFSAMNITDIITRIETTLNMTEDILFGLNFDPRVVNNITALLAEVNESYVGLLNDVIYLRKSLDDAQEMLDNAREYVESARANGFHGYPVKDIYMKIEALNDTLKYLNNISSNSYYTLKDYQTEVEGLMNILTALQDNAIIYEQQITAAYRTSQMAYSLANTTSSFGANISAVSSTLGMIEDSIVSLRNGTASTNGSISELETDLVTLDEQLMNLTDQFSSLSGLANILLNSANSIKIKSQMSLTSVQLLMASTNQALSDAQSLLVMIGLAQQVTLNASGLLTEANITASNITSVPTPPVDYATQLAHSINTTIISDQVIAELIDDANNSVDTAIETLALAQNASSDVLTLQDLVDTIISDFNETKGALNGAMKSLVQANGTLESVQNILTEVDNTLNILPEIDTVTSTVDEKLSELVEGERKLADLLLNATVANNTAQQIKFNVKNEEKVLEAAVQNLTDLERATSVNSNSTKTVNEQVLQLQGKAQQLNYTANAIELQRLRDLLTSYQTKVSKAQDVHQKLRGLQSDLKLMTKRLKESMEKYKNCYKTP